MQIAFGRRKKQDKEVNSWNNEQNDLADFQFLSLKPENRDRQANHDPDDWRRVSQQQNPIFPLDQFLDSFGKSGHCSHEVLDKIHQRNRQPRYGLEVEHKEREK